ncbi:MAG: hypothetical protein Q9218_004299 [Villophora microphyllina]
MGSMESGTIGTIGVTLTVLAATIAVANFFLGPKYNPKEPPVVHPKIPFVGHLVGLLSFGLRYFEVLSTKYPIPIFTLQTFGRRIYVVNSPDLISAVQKDAKNLTFGPFVSWMSPRIFDIGDEAMAAINENTDGAKGPYGLLPEISRGMHNALAPSESLDWMTRTMLTKLDEYVDPLGSSQDGTEIDLFRWIRRAFTVATRKGYQARKRFTKALTEYFDDNGHETGSDLIKARWAGNVKYNVAKYAGCFEIGDLIGVLVNATPTFFWMLVHIFSRPSLLTDLQAEISSIVEETIEATPSGASRTIRSIPVSKLKEHCPLLQSTYQETLRIQTHNTNTRWVKADTLLADQYFLKADSFIQMPGYPVHTLPSIWGPDAQCFNPRRFMKIDKKQDRENKVKQHPASFRSFGGGATLCPGRHFATAEICAATAMFVMRFDVVPVGNGGQWKLPAWAHGKVASAVPPPAKDVKVRVSTRKGEEGVEWRWGYEGSVSKFDVFAG